MVLLRDSSIVHFPGSCGPGPQSQAGPWGTCSIWVPPFCCFCAFLSSSLFSLLFPSISFWNAVARRWLTRVSPSFFSHFALFSELPSAPVLETFLRAPPGAFPHVLGCRCFGSTPQAVWGRVLKSLPSRNQMGCVSLWGHLGT